VSDPGLRAGLVDAGIERLGDFALHRTRKQLAEVLETLL
jgi:hypothetical protein